jgi:hypothetical protein
MKFLSELADKHIVITLAVIIAFVAAIAVLAAHSITNGYGV